MKLTKRFLVLVVASGWTLGCGAAPRPPAGAQGSEAAAEGGGKPQAAAPVAQAPAPAAPQGAASTSRASPGGSARPGRDWPLWGGAPERNMVNPHEKDIPAIWNVETGENVKYVVELGSRSYGNTVVGGGRIYVGTNNERERNPKIKGDKGVVMCFREDDGAFLWQAVHDKLPAGRVNDWPEEGICSSPCIEGDRVYYVSNRCELVCADVEGFLDGENDGPYKSEKYQDKIDGDFIWVLDMMEELTVFPHNLATSSPVIVGDLIFVLTSNGVDESHITIPQPDAPSFIAVNKNTGKVVWEDNSPNGNVLHGQWSCPSYGVIGGKPQVVFAGGDGWVRAFEPLTGKPLWKFDCNPKDAVYELGGRGTRNYIIGSPVIHSDHVYIGVGQDPEHGEGIGHLYSIDATAAAASAPAAGQAVDITGPGRTWHYGDKQYRRTLSTVAIHEGLVYAADLSGFLHCLDQKTGQPYWVHDLLSAVWGSPTVIDGKLFLGNEDGDVLVARTAKKFEILAQNPMGSAVYGTPVAAHGVLYVANRTKLFAIAQGARRKP